MLIAAADAAAVATEMESHISRITNRRRGFYGRIDRYLEGHHDLPYMPRGATNEYRTHARRAITNWLPLVSETFCQILFVEDYRSADEAESDAAWKHWQANKLDARQTIAHRAALEYGTGYVIVLPGENPGESSIRPIHPTRVWADYEDDDDEFPQRVLVRKGKAPNGDHLFELIDDEAIYTLSRPKDGGGLKVVWVEMHEMGYVPVVRFRDRLDGRNVGIIHPLINVQDRINEAVFNIRIAMQYAAFRQRWATGLVIPEDDAGNPVEPFESAVNRLWLSDNPDAKFGEFGQTDLAGPLSEYDSAVSTLAAMGRVSPHTLLGKLVNLSAEALAAAESITQRAGGQFEILFGESWELVLQCAAQAAGDPAPSEDAQVKWKDTEARSLAATVDALGKMVQMLGVPQEAAWRMIPDVNKTDVDSWLTMKPSTDGVTALADALSKSTGGRETLPTIGSPANPLPDASA